MVKVELVYIGNNQSPFHIKMDVENGVTVSDVLEQSGIYLLHPETKGMAVGIYAKNVSGDTLVKDGDRVEIYRPLTLDPKETRRQRAKSK